jgi:hypothetical protein
MKRIVLLVIVGLISVLATATAGATSNQPLPRPPAWGDFGNTTLPDCVYAADANLLEFNFPRIRLSESQVVQAFQANGEDDGLLYMETTGFDGIKAASVIPLGASTTGLQLAMAQGGVQAWIHFPREPDVHAVAVIKVTTNRVEFVSWGYTYWWSMKEYHQRVVQQYAFTWNSAMTSGSQ